MNEYHGCGDSLCVFGRPEGMQTNGGCRCLGDPWQRQQLVKHRVANGIRELRRGRDEIAAKCLDALSERDQLRGEVERMKQHILCLGHSVAAWQMEVGGRDTDIERLTALSAEKSATIERLGSDLERERHEFMHREHSLCLEIERMRALCAARPDSITVSDEPHIDNADGYRWLKKIADEGAKVKRGEGEE